MQHFAIFCSRFCFLQFEAVAAATAMVTGIAMTAWTIQVTLLSESIRSGHGETGRSEPLPWELEGPWDLERPP